MKTLILIGILLVSACSSVPVPPEPKGEKVPVNKGSVYVR